MYIYLLTYLLTLHWYRNRRPWMTLNGYFALKSVSGSATNVLASPAFGQNWAEWGRLKWRFSLHSFTVFRTFCIHGHIWQLSGDTTFNDLGHISRSLDCFTSNFSKTVCDTAKVTISATNRKSYTSFRLVPFLMILKYVWRSFQPRLSFPRPFQQPLACFRVARSPSNSWASC